MKALQRIRMSSEKKVLYKFTMSYLLIFFIPICVLFISVQIITKKIIVDEEKKTEEALTNNVEQIQLTMDEYLERSLAISYSIIQNESMHYLLQLDDKSTGSDVVSIYNVANQLTTLTISNNFVSDIVICMNRKSININQQGKVSDEDVYKNYIYQEDGGYSNEEWRNEAKSFTGGKLFFQEDGTLYFMQTYPVTPMEDSSKGVILIKMKEEVIKNTKKDTKKVNDYVNAIIDNKTGSILMNSSAKKEFMLENLYFSEDRGFAIQDGYLLAYRKSEQVPITYVRAIPQSVLAEQEYNMKRITNISFLLCTMLGSGLIIFFVFNAYNPIRQLLSLTKGENSSASSFLDPYLEIKSMLLDAADQKLAYMNLHERNDILDKQKTLIAILYDKKSTKELIQHTAEIAGISCGINQSCFIVLKCVDISSYFKKVNDIGKIDCTPIQFCETMVTKVLSESYNTTSIPYGREIFIIILLVNKKLELFHHNIKERLRHTQRLLQESYGIETLISISNFHSGSIGLQYGFQEANKTMEYMELIGNKSFTEYNLLPSNRYENKFNAAAMQEETMMINYIKSGDFNKAKAQFNSIINVYYMEMPYATQVWKFKLYAIISKILESLNYINIPDISKFIDNLKHHSDILNCNTIVEFQEHLNLLFDEMEEFCKNIEGKTESHFFKDVMDIVSHNYMNSDLNVSMIANILNKNLDYVSRTFKKLTGNGLLEYIHEFRITKAKDYLRENHELSIQQVSTMVGYINCESFIRVFKHKEGVTPGRYKSMIGKQK